MKKRTTGVPRRLSSQEQIWLAQGAKLVEDSPERPFEPGRHKKSRERAYAMKRHLRSVGRRD